MTKLVRSKILVVDDTIENIDLLVETLGDIYELYVVTSGEKALEFVSRNIPDLILLDIIMPGMDGYEVCRKLKADGNTSNIPIIFVTVMGETSDEQKGLSLGAVDYISKPFCPAIVKARVKKHLLIKHQRDQLEQSITLVEHENELLHQKADLGIQAGGLAHDMANILQIANLIRYIPRTLPKNLSDWQEIIEDLDHTENSLDIGAEICLGYTNYLANS